MPYQFEEVVLDSEGIAVRGELFLPAGSPPFPVVAICHGIPATVKSPDDNGYREVAARFSENGVAAFIFNFRGCGLSGGDFYLPGWTHDLGAVIDYLCAAEMLDADRLSLLGFSGGAAVAAMVASGDFRVRALALAACPAEFDFMDKNPDPQPTVDYFRGLGLFRDPAYPPDTFAWYRGFGQVKPLDYIARISPRSLLLAHGTADEVVPVAHAHRLYAGAAEPKELRLYDGVGHQLRKDPEVMEFITEWVLRQFN